MKLLLAHPTGNANVRAAAKGLLEGGHLIEFYTSIASFRGDMLDQFSSTIPSLAEIRRRRFDEGLKPITHTWPWHEAGRLLVAKSGMTSLLKHETGYFSIDQVYQRFDKRVARSLKRAAIRGVRAVYSYEDGASYSFEVAKQMGLACLYDLPIGYWRTARSLLEAERTAWPDWAATLTGFNDSASKLARKDEELHLADHIFVASRFTAQTLADYPGELAPISIIPYGFPAVASGRTYVGMHSRPLKLLFVGGLSQRKGIANLFAAVVGLERYVELTVIGQKTIADCVALNKALAKHRWIPSLAHDQVLALMREQDVLVFPSLFEGFGLVITEAMSQGTPVITTDRTAGPDLITHGKDGWLIEAGSTQALRQMIDELLRKPDQISKAGQAAMETARLRPWPVYGRELAEAVARANCSTTISL